MAGEQQVKVPVRFALADRFGTEVALCCPACGCEQVHPRYVVVEQSDTITHISGDGTNTQPSNRQATHRGSLIGLGFFCEHGCTFDYVLEFHKGTMGVAMSVGSHTDDLGELWRD